MDFNAEMQRAVSEGLRKAVADKLSGYNSPLDKVLADAVAAKSGDIRGLLVESITSCFTEQDFRQQIATAVRHKLAQILIQRFGGELEKQVNTLKSDPATRARIILAIEEIVNAKSP